MNTTEQDVTPSGLTKTGRVLCEVTGNGEEIYWVWMLGKYYQCKSLNDAISFLKNQDKSFVVEELKRFQGSMRTLEALELASITPKGMVFTLSIDGVHTEVADLDRALVHLESSREKFKELIETHKANQLAPPQIDTPKPSIPSKPGRGSKPRV